MLDDRGLIPGFGRPCLVCLLESRGHVAASDPFIFLRGICNGIGGDGRAAERSELSNAGCHAGFQDIATEKRTIIGGDGNEIDLYIEKPKSANGILPCVVHTRWWDGLHNNASSRCNRWRKALARKGLVVVAVEFRIPVVNLAIIRFPLV